MAVFDRTFHMKFLLDAGSACRMIRNPADTKTIIKTDNNLRFLVVVGGFICANYTTDFGRSNFFILYL